MMDVIRYEKPFGRGSWCRVPSSLATMHDEVMVIDSTNDRRLGVVVEVLMIDRWVKRRRLIFFTHHVAIPIRYLKIQLDAPRRRS